MPSPKLIKQGGTVESEAKGERNKHQSKKDKQQTLHATIAFLGKRHNTPPPQRPEKKRKMESNNRFSALCYEEDKGEEGEGEDSSLVKALTSLLED